MPTCEICGAHQAVPTGPEDSPLLVIGAVPYYEDIVKGRAWSLSNRKDKKGEPVPNGGSVIREEFRRVGIAWHNVRAMNFWWHNEVKEGDDLFDEEFTYHYRLFKEELKGRKAILMVGRQIMPMLFDKTITELEYLNVKSKHFPKSVEVCVVAKHPSIVLTDGAVVGDVRFAIERFADLSLEYRR